MTRSVWKGPFIDLTLIKKFDDLLVRALEEFRVTNQLEDLTDEVIKRNRFFITAIARRLSYEQPIEIWTRRSFVLPEFAGFYFNVYNGKSFRRILIKSSMVSHKFGEFVFTKRMGMQIHYTGKKKKGKSKDQVSKKKR